MCDHQLHKPVFTWVKRQKSKEEIPQEVVYTCFKCKLGFVYELKEYIQNG